MKIFISYPHENQEFCIRLARALASQNASVWIDIDSIKAGVSWASNISEAIQNTEIVLAIHSSYSIERSYQTKGEWLHAVDLGKLVIPVIVEGGVRVHPVLNHIQAVDFSVPGTFEDHFMKLWQAINTMESPQFQASPGVFTFDYSEKLSTYPVIIDGLARNYSELINHSSSIDCMAGVGHRFIVQHDSALMRRLASDAKLRLLVARPDYPNLKVIASWTSAPDLDLSYLAARSRRRALEVAEALERINKYVPSASVEFRVMECPASFTTFQFDSQLSDGSIVVTLYPLGPSIHPFLRPGILLKRTIFPDFYDHFRLAFQYAWDCADAISLTGFREIATRALPAN